MFLDETIERCSTCEELTAHSRRRIVVPWIASLMLIVMAVASTLLNRELWPLGGLMLLLAAVLLHHDMGKSWRLACERCRSRRVAERRRTKPALDGSTEINIF